MTVRTRRERVSLERSLGLPMVDGRSSKHALSWQTLGWSWRAGWAPGGCLCASDGRGGDFHQHSASPRVRRGRREKKKSGRRHTGITARKETKNSPTSASGKAPKKLETILSLYPTSRRQPALSILSTTTTWCPPTPSPPPPLWRSKTTHRNPCTWPALPLSDALWI